MGVSKSAIIQLPTQTAEDLKARVASGGYASEDEVIREGLRALDAQEDRVERWLRTEGLARDKAWKAAPGAVMTPEEVRRDLDLRASALRRTDV